MLENDTISYLAKYICTNIYTTATSNNNILDTNMPTTATPQYNIQNNSYTTIQYKTFKATLLIQKIEQWKSETPLVQTKGKESKLIER